MLTLTMQRWTDVPRDGIVALKENFKKLRAHPLFARVKGGGFQIELVPKVDGWHIHLHAIIDAKFIPYQQLFSAWREILGTSYVNVDIRAANTPQEIAYVTKYATKTADFDASPQDLVDWYLATKGSRLWGTWGTFYNAEELKAANLEMEKQFHKTCPHCAHVGGGCPANLLYTVFDPDAARVMYDPDTDPDPPGRARVWKLLPNADADLPF